MRRTVRVVAIALAGVVGAASHGSPAPSVPAGVTPQAAIPAIVAEFRSHPVVAIAESHGLRQAGDFYVALVRDPAFEDAVQDVVVEFASAQSQPLLDRYVVAGESIAPDSLRTIWRNTTKVAAWEYPIYARWLAAIRDVNRARPAAKRLRVLAGDTGLDWSRIRSHADWAALGDNNASFAKVIEEQVIARGHHALLVLGSNHLTRGGDRNGGPNTATRVDARSPGAMAVLWLYTGRPGGDDVESRIARERWPTPAWVATRGSWIGEIGLGNRRLADVADAVLYLAPSRDLTSEQAPPESFDAAYLRELDRRSWIEWGDSTRARRFLDVPAADGPDASAADTAAIPAGHVQEYSIASKLAGRDRRVWVYTPPGYSSGRDTLGLVVAFDGHELLTAIDLPSILDSLAAVGATPPLVAVLVDDSTGMARVSDLGNRAWFADFLADELAPWVRGRWRVTRDPHRVIVTGSSAGGLAAVYAALRHPEVFGNVVSQSGAFWRGNEASNDPPFDWLVRHAASLPRRDVRFWLEVGSTETQGALGGAASSILESNRALRDTLRAKGYAVTYIEVPGGRHATESWAPRLPAAIEGMARRR